MRTRINIRFYILFAGISLYSCQTEEEKIVYYPNGRAKMLYHKKYGQLNGTSKAYYLNGVTRSISLWQEGRKDGLSIQYYENGTTKNTSLWKNGIAHGIAKNYYSTGVLRDQTIWRNGEVFGKSYEYYPNGEIKKTAFISSKTGNRTVVIFNLLGLPHEKHIEGRDGKLIYVSSFDEQGQEESGIVVPLYENENDTVRLGGTYRGILHLGLQISKSTQLVISAAGKSYKKTDTLAFMPGRQGEAFYITRPALRLGENRFYFKFICRNCLDDTLSISTLSSSHSFFVKQ